MSRLKDVMTAKFDGRFFVSTVIYEYPRDKLPIDYILEYSELEAKSKAIQIIWICRRQVKNNCRWCFVER